MYIARDQDGILTLFSERPLKRKNPNRHTLEWVSSSKDPEIFYDSDGETSYISIDEKLFPEVTFENSPKKLIVCCDLSDVTWEISPTKFTKLDE